MWRRLKMIWISTYWMFQEMSFRKVIRRRMRSMFPIMQRMFSEMRKSTRQMSGERDSINTNRLSIK